MIKFFSAFFQLFFEVEKKRKFRYVYLYLLSVVVFQERDHIIHGILHLEIYTNMYFKYQSVKYQNSLLFSMVAVFLGTYPETYLTSPCR